MTELSQNFSDVLESMIDRTSVQAIVAALEAICYAKAEHVFTNRQDKELANAWTHNGHVLNNVLDELTETF